MAAPAVILLLVFFLAVVFRCISKIRKLTQIVDQIQGPRSFPVVGNALQLEHTADNFWEQTIGACAMYQDKPKILRMWLFYQPYIVIYGADEVILSSNKHINKGGEYRFLHPWLGLGLLTSYANKWRPRRKLLTPTFHYDILKDFMEVFNQQAKILTRILQSKCHEGPLDTYKLITHCALDIITQTAMGHNVNAQMDQESDYVKAGHDTTSAGMNWALQLISEHPDVQVKIHQQLDEVFGDDDDRNVSFEDLRNLTYLEMCLKEALRLFPSVPLFGRVLLDDCEIGKEYDWSLNVLHNFTKKVIKERYEEIQMNDGFHEMLEEQEGIRGKQRLAFLDLLLEMTERGLLTLNEVQNETDTFMFEGHDTTSAGMNWALQLISEHPDVQVKIHQQLDEVFGDDDDRNVSFEDLRNLTYLEMCLKEALRLFPSVPLFGRVLLDDCEIGGKTIPANTEVILVPYAVHQDPEHWPDPELFNPDRFLPENAAGRHPFAYLPFSAGSRNCIGQRFALMEEKTVIAWILRYFRVKPCQRRDQIRPKAELILRPMNGIKLKLELRRKPLA